MIKSIRSSSMPKASMCPGSLEASKGLKSEDTEWSKEGTLNHLAMQSYFLDVEFDESRLSDEGSLLTRWFIKEVNTLIEKHGGAKRLIPELELQANVPGTDITLTGHIDLVVLCEDGTTLIIDFKFGRLEVTPAAKNIQLLAYVWLYWMESKNNDEFKTDTIDAYIFSAGNDKAFTGVRYNASSLASAGLHLAGIIKKASDENAPRIPSEEACRYCEAKGTDRCPESKEWVEQAAVGLGLMKTEAPQLPADKQEVVRIFKAIKQVESFGRKFNAMLKEELQADPKAWGGLFELKPGNKVRKIVDVQGVYERIVEGADLVKPEALLNVVELPIGNLEALLKEPLKEAGVLVKDQKDYISDMLGELIEIKENEPSVKVIEK